MDTSGYAAKLNAKKTFKYGQRINGVVKSAAQLTRENSALMVKVATRANITGGVVGGVDCTLNAMSDFSNGNYT